MGCCSPPNRSPSRHCRHWMASKLAEVVLACCPQGSAWCARSRRGGGRRSVRCCRRCRHRCPRPAAEREFDGRQIGLLGRIHRLPIIFQDASGVAGVRVPVPKRPIEAAHARAQVICQRSQPLLIRSRLQPRAELADPHWRDVVLFDISPELMPDAWQVCRIGGIAEPGLRGDR